MTPAARIVPVLAREPELGRSLSGDEAAAATRGLIAREATLSPGVWVEPPHPGWIGYLLLDGLLTRDVMVAGATATELLGPGDLVQPWVMHTDDALVSLCVRVTVVEPTPIAVLDAAFAARLAQWPAVAAALVERLTQRCVRLSVERAIAQLVGVDVRLLTLFWHLAERWGAVSSRGVVLRLRLPHETLARLVGAKRPSVTTALGALERRGEIRREGAQGVLLLGSPPDELAALHSRAAVADELDDLRG